MYPHSGMFEIKEIAEWFRYKGKGQRTTISNFLTLYNKNIVLKFNKFFVIPPIPYLIRFFASLDKFWREYNVVV